MDHLTREGLSDKKSLEQRPEFSEGGGPCRGKVRVRGRGWWPSIPIRDKSGFHIFAEQLRRPVWLEMSYQDRKVVIRSEKWLVKGGDGVVRHARGIST